MTEIYSNKYHDCFLQYHIAFFTSNHIELETKEIDFIKHYFNSVAIRHEFKILAMEFDQNSVKLIINCQTTHFIPNIIKALKGGSARFLYKEYPASKTKHTNRLWDPKYIISTEEKQLDKMIHNYRGSIKIK
ncbi:IS200/IS605 family transposase [Bacillus sp. ISL-75]|uniref:IS200/IS605 family transposase n=1 Tax=Bacillus sp. ISL-75 TaxID=2819137 RepID=UPI001BEAE3F8|nr:IS200/IS605 family transposase [Bacillus sp. ISL-75]MBT2730448.1 IS200/IS605 family transposase [Bacillus sp. ISL-75]